MQTLTTLKTITVNNESLANSQRNQFGGVKNFIQNINKYGLCLNYELSLVK